MTPAQPFTSPSHDSTTLRQVGLFGLGIMGSAMARNLIAAGFTVNGHDPDSLAGQTLRSNGGRVMDPAELIRASDSVVLSLPSVAALDSVCAAIAEHGREGLIVAETSTLPIDAKQRAFETLASRGVVLLDCPLSGTGAQAVNRDLAVYASGQTAAVDSIKPIFDGFARVTYDIGAFGNGMRMKLMANLLVAVHNVSTAEALLMGARSGIDMDLAVKVLADGAGGSRMLEVRGPVMADRSWGAATMKVSTWQKDMKLIAEALAESNVPAPIFSAAIPVYNAAMGMGLGGADTAAVYEVLERMSSRAE